MMLTVVLGVVQLLGYSSADGTAIAFGEEREGSVVPAVFETRRLTEKDRTALKGVRTLIIENDIREIAAAAFAGASDLETVVLGEGVERIGARAFADAQKLQCVVFASRKTVDASLDTFAGAGDNLTAVYLNGYDRKVLHPSAVWTNMTRISGCAQDFVRTDLKRGVCYSGPKVTSDGWLYRVQDGEIACLERYLRSGPIVVVPSQVEGLRTGDELSYEAFGEDKFTAILCEGGPSWSMADKLTKNGCVYYKTPAQGRDFPSNERFVQVPRWVTRETLAACPDGVPEENGWRYFVDGKGGAAIIGMRGDLREARDLVIPGLLGGHHVVSLPAHLLAGRPNLASVEIPETVTEIPEGFCFGCPRLLTVSLPKKLKKIGRCAFIACPQLALQLPSGVQIDQPAFEQMAVGSRVTGERILLRPPED